MQPLLLLLPLLLLKFGSARLIAIETVDRPLNRPVVLSIDNWTIQSRPSIAAFGAEATRVALRRLIVSEQVRSKSGASDGAKWQRGPEVGVGCTRKIWILVHRTFADLNSFGLKIAIVIN